MEISALHAVRELTRVNASLIRSCLFVRCGSAIAFHHLFLLSATVISYGGRSSSGHLCMHARPTAERKMAMLVCTLPLFLSVLCAIATAKTLRAA